ncbi:uncharacterized protein F4812DRAFT_436092 [Daldinia caldariorum]|uniref:uncharacterized protein n=1 Tax=Daldinia caldariorum TaxID=326644 RepID=UPI002008D631|nr:uncharacterized protein F4812DRAFT_436092 [Daldinia caldariorum]KAI1466146.1 hypothetical protein F4812DRAFT_436092 [Daldinia caldariorum]
MMIAFFYIPTLTLAWPTYILPSRKKRTDTAIISSCTSQSRTGIMCKFGLGANHGCKMYNHAAIRSASKGM